MLCLSGFELYSRWVPLLCVILFVTFRAFSTAGLFFWFLVEKNVA